MFGYSSFSFIVSVLTNLALHEHGRWRRGPGRESFFWWRLLKCPWAKLQPYLLTFPHTPHPMLGGCGGFAPLTLPLCVFVSLSQGSDGGLQSDLLITLWLTLTLMSWWGLTDAGILWKVRGRQTKAMCSIYASMMNCPKHNVENRTEILHWSPGGGGNKADPNVTFQLQMAPNSVFLCLFNSYYFPHTVYVTIGFNPHLAFCSWTSLISNVFTIQYQHFSFFQVSLPLSSSVCLLVENVWCILWHKKLSFKISRKPSTPSVHWTADTSKTSHRTVSGLTRSLTCAALSLLWS